ncbi:LacI family DNA-binding transcriptional regulator [Alloalcanivorax mobilis]|uniref:LacI family DNA-binding transcriptional regulator n=1 Tax=Alloalcanivorax mobilis TaxID=2019569 RepID=UPI000B5B158A|nr:substrate-binding domain-containing protein [Alloalcanivorax mobilis]ASK32908.1 hypothetical protein CEK62_00185 [Alcanivorax sp. N3-2A]ASK36726.1 hypothetical protein CEK62_20375 [Alcanivorax sp. N3-2A]|tara:strand:- start:2984 stop:4003 length:1020 start_codon:yes stop_codon:yes gene_type:complete
MTGFTIKDVAREAKVSVGSVSRVLNGLAVSEAMKKKVDAAVAKLGYQPNSLARSMRTRSTGAVGFLVTDISNPLYGATINAVDARLRANGLMLLLASSGNRLQTELDVLAEFKRRRVDGLLMAPGSDANGPMLETLERFGAPIALMSGDFPRRFASVTTDYRSGVKSATRYLLDLGHRRIALLTPLAHLWPGRERIAGFRAAFREAGLPEQNALVRPQNLGLDTADDVADLLDVAQPPTALVLLGTRILAGALRTLRERRLRIPADLSIISIGDTEWTAVHEPPITALRWSADDVADALVGLLLAQINGVAAGAAPGRVTVPTELVLRGSCAAPRDPGA